MAEGDGVEHSMAYPDSTLFKSCDKCRKNSAIENFDFRNYGDFKALRARILGASPAGCGNDFMRTELR